MNTPQGIIVPPLSRRKIREIATIVRSMMKCKEPPFPITDLLEFRLARFFPGFEYDVLSMEEMGDNHGVTIPGENIIKIRVDVFDGAKSGNGRDRLTIAHEIGHFLLHRNVPVFTRRSPREGPVERYRDSEWQANCFAGELLIPFSLRNQNLTAGDLQIRCGVSLAAAEFSRKTWGTNE